MTKRKLQPKPEPVVPSEILASAKASIATDRSKGASRCVVCGSPGSPSAHDDLCWVCRRLKISAWRDIEQQAPIQE
ncbi:MAG TPA: hypothetical protein VGL72_10305 [Bryobacteraceae bacterium]|jgi:hypothetical protein